MRHHRSSTAFGDRAFADAGAWKSNDFRDRRRHRRDAVRLDEAAGLRVNHFRYAASGERHDRGSARQRLGDDQAVRLVPQRGHQGGRGAADQRRQTFLVEMSRVVRR